MIGDRTRTTSTDRDRVDSGSSSRSTVDETPSTQAHERSADRGNSNGLGGRIGRRAGRIFSPRVFVVTLIVTAIGLVATSALVPLPFSGLLGIFLGTFVLGLTSGFGRYVETTVAGAGVVAASTLADYFVVSMLGGFGVSLVAIGALLGGVVGALGTYFGRDLRAGMDREI
ncbi:MAG: hypothetical protein ACOCQ7_01170 [Natronomonas sp.]